jgi:hypothetical protein
VTRGILTEKIKKIMFSIFDRKLQEINGAATYIQVQAWKKSEETTWCYNHLDELIDETDENSSTYMDTIVSRVFLMVLLLIILQHMSWQFVHSC